VHCQKQLKNVADGNSETRILIPLWHRHVKKMTCLPHTFRWAWMGFLHFLNYIYEIQPQIYVCIRHGSITIVIVINYNLGM